MRPIRFPIASILVFTFLFSIYSCKKDKHSGCYSAKVIHIGKEASVDPCQGDIAVLTTDVENVPAGTTVFVNSTQSDRLNLALNQTIYFKLNERSEVVPGILRGCSLDPKHNFGIELCE